MQQGYHLNNVEFNLGSDLNFLLIAIHGLYTVLYSATLVSLESEGQQTLVSICIRTMGVASHFSILQIEICSWRKIVELC